MKNVILMMAMCLGMFACGNNNAKKNKLTEEQSQKDHVEVLYFHGKQRCATCVAIEKNAKEAIETQFANELKSGTVVFKSIDISKAENEKMFICRWKDGKETYKNLTEYAFANARTAPDTFKSGVIEKVKALMK